MNIPVETGAAERPDHVVVVGGGVAGLATALRLAPLPVLLLARDPLGEGAATPWAQGGIAAAIGADDAPELHAQDTVKAGAGLTEPEVARAVAGAAPAAIDWLVGLGTPFDRTPEGALALGMEAAHARRRIAHAGGDSTGRAVLETLAAAVHATPSITLVERLRATHLLRDANSAVRGIAATGPTGQRAQIAARAVVLATGGLGGLYGATTNPLGAVGSGLALAARAGAVMRDMEFVQFHPTAIVAADIAPGAGGPASMPLATEALRGEGAILLNDRGERFMAGVPGAELAPRDVVARAIFAEIAAGRRVFLDARMEGLETRFPGVVALCRQAGIDPLRAPIPVRPAAHYHMGGIAVDARGRASLDGLWACGEVASTGLHGANRLASNSLLEALAYARWIAADIAGASAPAAAATLPVTASPVADAAQRAEIRALMERQVGVVREGAGLAGAARRLAALAGAQFDAAAGAFAAADDAALVALMVAAGALARRESRGGHFRADFPLTAAVGRHADTTLGDTLEALAGADADRRVA
ncbi:L-aspartate oxidase [Ancylobacter terrae]|uniref:L-aspartate oxidase n=1 Tax=Ancylobacter sp. sgz301288 TaxID=3342077 RepID=UPI00385FC130